MERGCSHIKWGLAKLWQQQLEEARGHMVASLQDRGMPGWAGMSLRLPTFQPSDRLGSHTLKFTGAPGSLWALASSCPLAPLPIPTRGLELRQLPKVSPPADLGWWRDTSWPRDRGCCWQRSRNLRKQRMVGLDGGVPARLASCGPRRQRPTKYGSGLKYEQNTSNSYQFSGFDSKLHLT